MHFFVFGVFPAALNQEPHPSPTAYVSCWINDPGRESALAKAKNAIHVQGWKVAELVEDYPISREDYTHKTEGLEYYEQALVDGEVLVFFVPKASS